MNSENWLSVMIGILIPFLGTTLGAACVFFLRNEIGDRLSRALSGFAGGIMISASFFSLILTVVQVRY